MNKRKVVEQIQARSTSDGDGVKLMRVFGGPNAERFDPFLMLDEFGSEDASDYIGGFPSHPHRGFETVTYMLQGKMEHKDHMGNVGLLKDSDVQWMTAGKGIIHSEMPQQTEGKMRGFQLWVNLPAAKKMTPARYQDVPGGEIPVYKLEAATIKALAGKTKIGGTDICGYFDVADTKIVYLDIHLNPGARINIPVENEFNALVYIYDGEAVLGEKAIAAPAQTVSRLDGEGEVIIHNPGNTTARIILLAGKPLNEPIAQYGPFVMNTAAEINQAMADYQAGVLTD